MFGGEKWVIKKQSFCIALYGVFFNEQWIALAICGEAVWNYFNQAEINLVHSEWLSCRCVFKNLNVHRLYHYVGCSNYGVNCLHLVVNHM
jgi:hypothetical protein